MKLVPYTGKLAYYASIILDPFDYTHNYADTISTNLLWAIIAIILLVTKMSTDYTCKYLKILLQIFDVII